MRQQISVLMVEDSKKDAELALRELKRAGLDCVGRRVDTDSDFRSALYSMKPDIILSDFSMPRFDGMSALALAWELCPDVPFIFLSGTIGEEYAIRALKNGASDYVLKDNLMRLPPAVERAIADTRSRNAQKHIEKLRALEHAVTSCLAYADGVSSGLTSAIRTICEMAGWECGRYFLVDESSGFLRVRESWAIEDPIIERFLAVSRNLELAPGIGLPGRVSQSGEPMWSTGTSSSGDEARESLMPEFGIRSSFSAPVVAEGRVIGVLSFSSQEVIEPDDGLLQTMRVIGSQVGHVTQRMRIQEEQRRFRVAMDTSADMIALIDRASMRYVDVNRTICELLGYTRAEMLAMGPQDILPLDRETLERSYDELIANEAGSATGGVSTYYRCKDGSQLPFESTRCVVHSGDTRVVVAVARDVRKRIEAEEALRKSHERFHLAVHATNDVIWDWDLTTGNLWWNENLMRAFGYEPGELEGGVKAWYDLIHAEDQQRVVGALHRIVELGGDSWVDEYRLRRRDGGYAFVIDRAHILRDARGRALRMIGAKADATALKEAEGRLSYLAQFDLLTGLPNRHLFRDRVGQMLIQARRNNWPVAVLFVDLDRFKLVNEALGQEAGDRLLKELGARLAACVRTGDTIGCFGGDKFAAVLSDLGRPGDAGAVAQKILEAVAAPFHFGDHDAYVTASVGITLFPGDGLNEDVLMAHADTAMHRAKENGGSNYQFFTHEMNERTLKRMQTENALRHALAREEFLLHYQPKADLKSGAICGFEALLRWKHPERGLVSPAEFIPILEETGLIVAVGEWVLREACQQIASWQKAGLPALPVAVNLSARQFEEGDLAGTVRRILAEAQVATALIHFEITESLLMKDPEGATRALRGLRDSGFKLSVDDFGTGYSSLAYLKRFPLDALKIDQTFVRDITNNPDDAAIALAVIGLARSLNLYVIAEGVETLAQLDFLRKHGCDEIQGYYFSKPLPAADSTRALAEGRCLQMPDNKAT
ncbi:MAG TPA: EAL domain-containing protein [Burkholderiales bacterium]|jgi:diguanylate cyclase (GGDEF)-like protein/PAS domain S-box-containing protein|nr:EAL domain-containing protein [Burkholderiales bacterium]